MKRTPRQAGKLAQQLGELCEQMVLNHAKSLGHLVQRIATPCVVIRGRKVYTEKVIGDIVGVNSEGKAILIECKCHVDGRRPRRSDFKKHQIAEIEQWHARGAVVLVAWLDESRRVNLLPAVHVTSKKAMEAVA